MPKSKARKIHAVALADAQRAERTVAQIVGLSLAGLFTLMLALNALTIG